MIDDQSFIPVITVLPEPGSPFLWIVKALDQGGVGPCLCNSSDWDESLPLSQGLWQKFADWENEFDNALRDVGYIMDLGEDWGWVRFHVRGLQLARWLKEDVGDAYRVVYMKPGEDPDCRCDERREVMADGTLVPLPPFRRPQPAATSPE